MTPPVALAGSGLSLYFAWSPDGRYLLQVHLALPPARATLSHTLVSLMRAALQQYSLLCRRNSISSAGQQKPQLHCHMNLWLSVLVCNRSFIPISSAIPLRLLSKERTLSFVILKVMLSSWPSMDPFLILGQEKTLCLMYFLLSVFLAHLHVCKAPRLPRLQAAGEGISVVDVDAVLVRAPSAPLDLVAAAALGLDRPINLGLQTFHPGLGRLAVRKLVPGAACRSTA